MYPLHQNDTGSFQELAHASDVEFGQLSLLTVKPGCQRGGHYHTWKREWFCCVAGRCHLVLCDTNGVQTRAVILDDRNREFVVVEPYESHTVLNASAQECVLLVIVSAEYDPEDADTFKPPESCETHGVKGCEYCGGNR